MTNSTSYTDVAVIGAGGVVGGALSRYMDMAGFNVRRNDIKGGDGIVSMSDALADSPICFVCVPTPSVRGGGIDLQHVKKVTNEIAKICKTKGIEPRVVYKSTMVPGSTQAMHRILLEQVDHAEVAYNPEFLRQKHALQDMIVPPRIVVGSYDTFFAELVMDLYHMTDAPKFTFNSTECAELVKYYANAYYAARISFFNQMAMFAKKTNSRHQDIVNAIIADKSVGVHGSNPTGKAYGGACLIKDLDAIIAYGYFNNIDVRFLESVKDINCIMEGEQNV